mmetsp:Transcript_7909/g.28066  ORF Transcript_7909/g.28066 Transcript_7909/m.28066 type:complete len:283 (+) Transcript_7909:267-1115(+)
MAPTTPTAYRAWARRTRLARDVTRVKITARGARRPCSRAPVVGLSRPWASRAPFRSPSRNGHLGPKSKTLAVRPRSSQTTKRPLARRSARPAGLSGSARARATLPRETGGPADAHVSNLSVRAQIVITDRGGRCGAAGRGSGASWFPFRIDRSGEAEHDAPRRVDVFCQGVWVHGKRRGWVVVRTKARRRGGSVRLERGEAEDAARSKADEREDQVGPGFMRPAVLATAGPVAEERRLLRDQRRNRRRLAGSVLEKLDSRAERDDLRRDVELLERRVVEVEP